MMKPYFKSVITALVITGLVLTFTVGGLAPRLPRVAGRADISERRVFSWPDSERLVLDNPDGFIIVESYDEHTISAQVDIKAFFVHRDQDREAAQNYLTSLIEAESSGGVLRVVTEPGERPDGLELLVLYSIKVPVGTDLDIVSSNGNVWIKKGCGSVTVRGSNTDIRVEEPLGPVVADSLNGRISVQGAPQGCRLKTVNGSIFADVRGGILQADTTNGGIYARLLDASVEGCELTSQNGTIKLVVSEQCSAEVDARTRRGTVTVTSDLSVDTSAGVRRSRHIKGIIGQGRGRLTMHTLNGNIVIAGSST